MTWLSDKINEVDNPGTIVVSTRTVDGAAFVPSASKYTLCSYSIQHVVTEGQDGSVELRCDAANPPTVVRAISRVKLDSDGAATPGGTFTHQVFFLVPPGFYAKLVATGTGTPTVVAQSEIPIS